MKFVSSVLAALSLSAIPFSAARGKKAGGGKGGKSGGGDLGGVRQFTPGPMFVYVQDTSLGDFVYTPNPDIKLQMFREHYHEDDEGWCSANICTGEYFSFVSKGYKKSPTSYALPLVVENFGSVDVLCPLPTMRPSVLFLGCLDGTPGGSVTISTSVGPYIDSFSSSGCSDSAYKIEIICTGTEEDVEFLDDFEPEDSLGWENRERSIHAMMYTRDTTGEPVWLPDYRNNYFEVVDIDLGTTDASGCNAYSCYGDYHVVYVFGTDNNKATFSTDGNFASAWVTCPCSDQTTTALNPTCTTEAGVTTPASSITFDSYGPVLKLDFITCGGSYDFSTFEAVCSGGADRSSGSASKSGKKGKSKSRRVRRH